MRQLVPRLAVALAVLAAGLPLRAAAEGDAPIGQFAAWDVNGDGAVSQDEFALGMGTLGVYRRWDSDQDGMLSDEEFRAQPPAAMENVDADLWTAWDLDGDAELNEREVEAGYFARFDRNGDGIWERAEWLAFRDYAREQGWPSR